MDRMIPEKMKAFHLSNKMVRGFQDEMLRGFKSGHYNMLSNEGDYA